VSIVSTGSGVSAQAATGASSAEGGEVVGTGLVTLVVGEVGRAGAGARSRRAAPAGGGSQAAVSQAGGAPGDVTAAQPGPTSPPGVSQWSCQWSADGPGPIAPGPQGEADLTLTLSTQDAQSIWDRHLDPSVAFMQGRLKTTGDNALLLKVLCWSATPAFSEALSSWSADQSLLSGPVAAK
jgi:hypothetical protein